MRLHLKIENTGKLNVLTTNINGAPHLMEALIFVLSTNIKGALHLRGSIDICAYYKY